MSEGLLGDILARLSESQGIIEEAFSVAQIQWLLDRGIDSSEEIERLNLAELSEFCDLGFEDHVMQDHEAEELERKDLDEQSDTPDYDPYL